MALGLSCLALTFVLGGCVYYLNPLCTDQIKNGEETDIDCGGTCGKCELGDSCKTDNDCDNAMCTGGKCTPLPCDNNVKDLAETDVDCGGGTCRKCSGGHACVSNNDCFSGNCVAATGTCFGLTDVSFADQVQYGSGEKTYWIFSGDLDGDTDIDIAAANEQESSLSVFVNNGTGTFAKMPMPFATGEYPTGGDITDMNKDGVADIVTADYHGDSVSVLLGMGGGVLRGRRSYATEEGAETSNLAVGDLNNDGFPDIIATNPATASISVFLAHADGTLEPANSLPVGVNGAPFSCAIGDFDKDGKNDVAIADMRTNQMIVRLGNGDGTFGDEVGYPEGGIGAFVAVTRDMDLDGVLDLVIANRGSDNVSVLLGRGDGTFRKPLLASTGKDSGPYSIAVADFNLDGVLDAVTGNFMSSNATVLIGIGNGQFEKAIDAGACGMSTYGITAGLFDGDMKPDFATANAVTNDIAVKMNTSR